MTRYIVRIFIAFVSFSGQVWAFINKMFIKLICNIFIIGIYLVIPSYSKGSSLAFCFSLYQLLIPRQFSFWCLFFNNQFNCIKNSASCYFVQIIALFSYRIPVNCMNIRDVWFCVKFTVVSKIRILSILLFERRVNPTKDWQMVRDINCDNPTCQSVNIVDITVKGLNPGVMSKRVRMGLTVNWYLAIKIVVKW